MLYEKYGLLSFFLLCVNIVSRFGLQEAFNTTITLDGWLETLDSTRLAKRCVNTLAVRGAAAEEITTYYVCIYYRHKAVD